MYLAGQDKAGVELGMPCKAMSGYAMVALLVSLSIMGVMLSVAMPVWKQLAQREKEAELVFRGQQYARAIGLFQRRAGPGTLPPNLDILVEQRFLRKKYKDPITNEEFLPVFASQVNQAPGGRGGVAPGQNTSPPGQSANPPGTGRATSGRSGPGEPGSQAGAVGGGIVGVVSKSKAKSIRIFNGRNSYDQWAFTFVPPPQAAGEGGQPGASGGRGGPGGRGGGPGSPGQLGAPGAPFGPGSPFGPGPGADGGRAGPPGRGAGPGGVPQSPFGPTPFQPQPFPPPGRSGAPQGPPTR